MNLDTFLEINIQKIPQLKNSMLVNTPQIL